MEIKTDGTQTHFGEPTQLFNTTINGFALGGNGHYYLPDLEHGFLFSLDPSTSRSTLVDSPGDSLSAVVFSNNGNMYVIACTTGSDYWEAFLNPHPTGYVYMINVNGVKQSQASGLYFPTHGAFGLNEDYFYVAELHMSRIIRFPVDSSGNLGTMEIYQVLGNTYDGYQPYGLAFDIEENLFVSLIFRVGIAVVTPQNIQHTIFEDYNATSKCIDGFIFDFFYRKKN